ncbi:hypothetical protein Pcinc_005238 [Petrolisthes cinctipes]|uniref:Secreted protein n=1 Tax=Petrolisthes cinctipes TaxID=88211 RepID=A0AAE1GD29_PETCI|nr:hypothetical protein Pcinc_005238 [Petrolisthes cinctipes]
MLLISILWMLLCEDSSPLSSCYLGACYVKQPLGRSERRDIDALDGQPSRGGAEHQTSSGNPGCGHVKDTCINSGGDFSALVGKFLCLA